MKIAVVGSRGWKDKEFIELYLSTLLNKDDILVSGGAAGVDSIAESYAKSIGVSTLVFKPDWDTYGKSAGFIRNTTIVENADWLVAFWDGTSRGTLDSINKALLAKNVKQIVVFKGSE